MGVGKRKVEINRRKTVPQEETYTENNKSGWEGGAGGRRKSTAHGRDRR